MDNDDRWRMYDIEMLFIEAEQVVLELEELMADYFLGSNPPARSRKTELTPHDEWLNRRLSRRRRRPKRQLHPCRLYGWDRWERRERSHHRAERSVLTYRTGMVDLAEQIDDYDASEFTDIPSAGLSVSNEFFSENLGPYPIGYDGLDEESRETEDQWSVPDWQFQGFDSPEEYEEYLSSYAAMYETDWHDPIFSRRASSQLETA